MSTNLKSRLAHLLDAPTPDPSAVPVERLASALGRLAREPALLDECNALLGDGLTGALLYDAHPEAVLAKLEHALEVLDDAQRRRLVTAALEMRPIRAEDHVRWVAFSLTAFGLRDGRAPAARAGFTTDELVVLHRWSTVLSDLSALQITAVTPLLAACGIDTDGESLWHSFQAWLDFRAAVVVTPRQSTAARRLVEEMQRPEWLDMPFLLATPEGLFTMDEVEEDASPANMTDGGRLTELFVTQRLPWLDVPHARVGWHPRQTLETSLAEAARLGVTVLPPRDHDANPPIAEGHELDWNARAVRAEALRVLAETPADGLPPDLALVFRHAEDGHVRGALELTVPATLDSDGKKILVAMRLGDAAALVAALRAHGPRVTTETLPLLLARAYASSPAIFVRARGSKVFRVEPSHVAAWDAAARRHRPATAAVAAHAFRPELAGTWRGTMTNDHGSEPEPCSLVLDSDGRGTVTWRDDEIPVRGDVHDGRLALRPADEHRGEVSLALVVDAVWDEAAQVLEGGWRRYSDGGSCRLEREAASVEPPSAEELMAEVTTRWRGRVGLDLEALRFPGERETMQALFADELFREEYVRAAKNRGLGTEATRLDSMLGRGATELTRALLPSAFQALDAAVAALGFDARVRLWVHNDSSLNAFVTMDGDAVTVHFTSGLLDVLDEVELRAVIGHELGHVFFGVHDLAMRVQYTKMSGAARMRYFALRRFQELSADRASLAACGDLRAVFMTQVLMQTGIRKRELLGTVDAVLAAARAELDVVGKRADRRAALESHPYCSLRMVALERFAAKAPVAELTALGKLLEAPALQAESDVPPHAVARLQAAAALQLVEMDRSVSAREVHALMAIPGAGRELQEVLGWSHERRVVEMFALSRHVRTALTVPQREAFLTELLRVVRADDVIDYSETSALRELSWLLEVDTASFKKTIDELTRVSR